MPIGGVTAVSLLAGMLFAGAAHAAPLGTPVADFSIVKREVGEITLNGAGTTVARYTWRDSQGRARSAALTQGGGGSTGYAVRFTYEVDDGAGGSRVVNVDADPAADGGFGYFVSHELYRNWSDGAPSSTIAHRHSHDDSPLGRYLAQTGSASNAGSARAVHEFRQDYPRWGTVAANANPDAPLSPSFAAHQLYMVPVVIRWTFTMGHDYPLWSVEADLAGLTDKVAMDVRGPYGVMRFNEGVGNAVTALRWGDRLRFAADAGSGDFGVVAKAAGGLAWTWNQANTGRRYNVLGSNAYEFGIVDTVLASASRYGDGYANFRGLTSASGGCGYGLASLPCDWEWAFQSFQYDYAPDYNATTRPKLAWGSSPYLGTSLTEVYTNPSTPVPLNAQGRISYGVHVVFGRAGTGTPLALAQAAAPLGGPHNLELRVAPKRGGSAAYQVLGDGATYTDRMRPLPSWSSVKASGAAATGFKPRPTSATAACGANCPCKNAEPECRFAMDSPLRVLFAFEPTTATTHPNPPFLDFGPQPAGTVSPRQPLGLLSSVAGSPSTVTIQSSSPEFVVTDPCSGFNGSTSQLSCTAYIAFAPAPGPARVVQAELTITRSGAGTYTPIYVDVEGIASESRPTMDFSNDGRSDLLWRNAASGQAWRLLMNGFSVTSSAAAHSEPDLQWRIVATGDSDADGTSDLVWRHSGSGSVVLQRYGSNGTPISATALLSEPNPAWQLLPHMPDFNGDGRADLLWWNSSTGQVYRNMLDGPSVVSQGFIYQEPDTNWRIVASGDFTGTGKRNQLLWRHQLDGRVYLMTVDAGIGGGMLYAEPNTAWKIVATGDFDGNARTDILWRNDATGQLYMMLKGDGLAIVAQGMVYAEPNAAWKIVAAGDYDGDGRSDLLWWNSSSGEVFMMRMNGLAIAAQQMIYREADTAWKLLGPGTLPQ